MVHRTRRRLSRAAGPRAADSHDSGRAAARTASIREEAAADAPPSPMNALVTENVRDPKVTSRIMAAVRGKNTEPEWLLRRALFRRGLRFRVHVKTLPGRPDIVFSSVRVVVFVDGDFWHGAGWRER